MPGLRRSSLNSGSETSSNSIYNIPASPYTINILIPSGTIPRQPPSAQHACPRPSPGSELPIAILTAKFSVAQENKNQLIRS
jgi:hypothetical protein